MDANNLLNDLEIFASNGIVFSREQRVTLQNSLTVTKAQYNFSRIKFWGKISGLKDDYFVAQGYRKTHFSGNNDNNNNDNLIQTLYSLNGGDWCILEDVDENVQKLALSVKGRFIGDPSFTYEINCSLNNNNDVAATENLKNTDSKFNSSENNKNNNHNNFGQGDSQELRILEETRLSAVVSIITKTALVCPKNSITSDGRLNSQWNGLDGNQATDLSNWVDGENNEISREKQGINWSIQKQRGQGVDCVHVILKNLEWLGAIAFHTTETNQFGNIYVGNGEFNMDLSFMI